MRWEGGLYFPPGICGRRKRHLVMNQADLCPFTADGAGAMTHRSNDTPINHSCHFM